MDCWSSNPYNTQWFVLSNPICSGWPPPSMPLAKESLSKRIPKHQKCDKNPGEHCYWKGATPKLYPKNLRLNDTLFKTNIAPEKWWGYVSFREGTKSNLTMLVHLFFSFCVNPPILLDRCEPDLTKPPKWKRTVTSPQNDAIIWREIHSLNSHSTWK